MTRDRRTGSLPLDSPFSASAARHSTTRKHTHTHARATVEMQYDGVHCHTCTAEGGRHSFQFIQNTVHTAHSKQQTGATHPYVGAVADFDLPQNAPQQIHSVHPHRLLRRVERIRDLVDQYPCEGCQWRMNI